MFKNVLLANPTLAIKTSSSALVKYSAFSYLANGVFKTVAAADAPALSGSVLATAYTRVAILYITAWGTLAWDYSDDVANTADLNIVKLAAQKRALRGTEWLLVGYVVIKNATGSNFTPGTTALDTASLTVTYINAYGLTPQDETV